MTGTAAGRSANVLFMPPIERQAATYDTDTTSISKVAAVLLSHIALFYGRLA
jgi:hypothetical protein